MWLFTSIGFFSVVQKPRQTDLTIRARVAADLDRLRERYLPSLSPTRSEGGTDYPYRATASREAWTTALAKLGCDVTYANFKAEVTRSQGMERERIYERVWGVLRELEEGLGRKQD